MEVMPSSADSASSGLDVTEEKEVSDEPNKMEISPNENQTVVTKPCALQANEENINNGDKEQSAESAFLEIMNTKPNNVDNLNCTEKSNEIIHSSTTIVDDSDDAKAHNKNQNEIENKTDDKDLLSSDSINSSLSETSNTGEQISKSEEVLDAQLELSAQTDADDSTNVEDSTHMEDSTNFEESTNVDAIHFEDSTNIEKSTKVRDSTSADNSTNIDDLTNVEDSINVNDSTNINDSTDVEDSTNNKDLSKVEDSLNFKNLSNVDESLSISSSDVNKVVDNVDKQGNSQMNNTEIIVSKSATDITSETESDPTVETQFIMKRDEASKTTNISNEVEVDKDSTSESELPSKITCTETGEAEMELDDEIIESPTLSNSEPLKIICTQTDVVDMELDEEINESSTPSNSQLSSKITCTQTEVVDMELDDEITELSASSKSIVENTSKLSNTEPEKQVSNETDSLKEQSESNDKSSKVLRTTSLSGDATAEKQDSEQNDAVSEVDDQEVQQENPLFVHVNSKDDAEGEDKTISDVDVTNDNGDDSEVLCLTEEDPIGISHDCDKDLLDYTDDSIDKETVPLKVVDFNAETITSDKSVDDIVSSKGADEELCIIPDTERVISQEEKDAATAAAAAAADANTEAVASKDSVNDSSAGTVAGDATSQVSARDNTVAPSDVRNKIGSQQGGSERQAVSTSDDFKVTEISKDDATDRDCHRCNKDAKCLYKVSFEDKTVYICTDTCLSSFRSAHKSQLEGVRSRIELKLKDVSKKLPASINKVFVRKCSQCASRISSNEEKVLSWETMDFCNEDCLAKYQNKIGSHCANCKKVVLMSSLGKYCVRFGHDIRQFCCSLCLEEFKKGLKVCSYCQKDISGGTEGFLAPVGDKGQFKDFCSQLCMEKYNQMGNKNSNKKVTTPVDIAQCSVCNNELQVLVLFEQMEKKHKFCSEPCFVAFKFVNNADPIHCDMCKKYFENENSSEFSIFYDNVVRNFCCKTCQNIYIIANRRIVPCSWCKVKKYNFDMIKKTCSNNQVLMMCSLNCLSLFQVSINAVSSKKMKCDYCSKISQAQYHLTMSDATIRNFCTYHCVMSFQNQFSKLPITLSEKTVVSNSNKTPVVPASGPKRYQSRMTTRSSSENANEVQLPVITNVQSLANTTNGPSNMVTRSSKNNQQNLQQQVTPIPQVKQQVIIKAPPLPLMKNAITWCKPILHTKGVSCRPHPCSKETQTDVIKEKTVLIPIPVPIYVPAPMHMYSAPVPVPIPFPLPIPVPIFIPTTRNSSAGIMKEIKKIQVKIPTDPFEAELLMMAEMVAGEKKVDNTDSESEDEDNAGSAADGGFSPEAVDTSNTFGDDMLQMALKMATELDEPAVDLEGALTANTITASQNPENAAASEESVDDPQPIHQLIERQSVRGRKRPGRPPRNASQSKRGRRMSTHVEMPLLPPPQPQQPPEPIEKPDANMCLKYTFGVNAWKQWVTTKNAELEKSSRRVKLFKNEILQLTADELNYSLCLFVKEVRKPNGTEYAPDTIYYLCLGIQQYLFENGRIDNIFTDTYYEKFTDCLDEVARKFSVLYNDSHYIVTRVEEEHLWESKQLGAHSPHVLLSTLMFFNTKHFNLTTVDEHMQLSFSHIMKHWKRNPNQPGAAKIPGSRNVLLRFYPPQTTLDANSRKKKVYEQQENEENPLRCPVKLYEFYLSKCPESVKTRNDVFYLLPERSCVPDSPVWYSTMALGREALEKMLHRVKMVKEINVALLTS